MFLPTRAAPASANVPGGVLMVYLTYAVRAGRISRLMMIEAWATGTEHINVWPKPRK